MRKIMMACAAFGALVLATSAHAATINMDIDTVDRVNGYDIVLTGINTDGSNVATSFVSGTVTGFGTYSFLTGGLSLVPTSTSVPQFLWDNVVTSTSPFFSNTGSSGLLLLDVSGNAYINPYNLSGALFSSIAIGGGGSSNPGDAITAATFQTPLPAALPLFAGALGVLGYSRRKKKASVTA